MISEDRVRELAELSWSDLQSGSPITSDKYKDFVVATYEQAIRTAAAEAIKSEHELIDEFGDHVTDMFEQMIKGKWTDDKGHGVQMNSAMLALKETVKKAIRARSESEGV